MIKVDRLNMLVTVRPKLQQCIFKFREHHSSPYKGVWMNPLSLLLAYTWMKWELLTILSTISFTAKETIRVRSWKSDTYNLKVSYTTESMHRM